MGGGRWQRQRHGTQSVVNPAAAPREPPQGELAAQLSALSVEETPEAPVTLGSEVNAQASGYGASQVTGMAAGFGGPGGFGSFSLGTAQVSRRRSNQPAASQAVIGSGPSTEDEGLPFTTCRSNFSVPQKDNFSTNQEKAVIHCSPSVPRTEDADLLLRILNGEEKPTNLPLALLKDITNDFSEERRIGHGGFGDVYKGVKRIEENTVLYTVAVKKIRADNNKLFHAEVTSLMNIEHRNIVRFLGFCSSTHHEWNKHPKSGENNLVDVNARLLCMEYIRNGSLDKYISDELRGFDWERRYDIITGICEGLRYLHEDKNIIHMDLKPGNILLQGKCMVPKITDFGLSRPNKETHTKSQPIGTEGYYAPEYWNKSKTSLACDIYSLGAIIMELVTGGMDDIPNIHNVLRRWRHRWNKAPTPLQYHQITGCIAMAVRCREHEPEDRPHILEIISTLSEPGSTHGQERTYMDDDMLGIEPLELDFYKEMSWSVKLTNKTKAFFAFRIDGPSKHYTIDPDKGIVTPGCNEYLVQITLQQHEKAPQVTHNVVKFVVQSTTVNIDFTVEDITDRTFNKETGKDVDELNLMVVPKEEQRNIIRSASGKGKLDSSENEEGASMDINSRAQRQCNLHPLESFARNYRAETKYLLEESDRAVDLSRGAMGSLLDKLGKLVTEDYNLDKGMKADIESFSEVLMNIHLDLPRLENVVRAKVWVDKVRELSYHIEDMVDSFLVCVETDSSRSGFRELTHEGLKLWKNGMMTHHQIVDVIRDIKDKVQAVAKTKVNYNINVQDVVATTTVKVSIEDLRNSPIYEDVKEKHVGIKVRRKVLIRLLEKDGNVPKENLKVVSIVGMGGLGKTTLAKAVYDKVKEYDPKAFVPMGLNTDVKTVLKNIIFEVKEDYNAERLNLGQLINKLKELLDKKRYFIVIDDIWDSSAWGVIKSAFPRNNRGSRMIITTRKHDVALACCNFESKYVHKIKRLDATESKKLFFRRTFGPDKELPDTPRKEVISTGILEKCHGMPLAINSMASLLAGNVESTWEYVWNYIDAMIAGDAMTEGEALENMKQILDLSYIHLPDDLKTCLLYVCMYPQDREIDKNDLLRQWVAEGFVRTNGRLDAEDVAKNTFKALINMCMIEPGRIDYNNEVLSCRVHYIILELMRSKSSKENFIHVIDGSEDVSGQIRRVSVQYKDKKDTSILETIKGSLQHARSVMLCQGSLLREFLKYTYIRVLQLEREIYLEGLIDLTYINRLFLLRYIRIAFHGSELKLPDQIGQLQQLETIHIQTGKLKNYPSDIVSLPWLSHLIYGGRIVLPDGIGRLKSLRTLVGVCVHTSSVENIKGLGELHNLRRLDICSNPSDEATSMHMVALHSSICKLSASLRTFSLGQGTGVMLDVSHWRSSIFPQVSNIRDLDLGFCNFRRCPEWINQLHNLYKFRIWVREVADGLSIVGGLTSLAYFELHTTGTNKKEESVVIYGSSGTFQALKHLIFSCPKASLTFEAGAMPKLEKLEILFPYDMAPKYIPVGIEYLPAPTLKEISLCMDMDNKSVKGCQDWNEKDWDDYFNSDEYIEELDESRRRFRAMLKRAFKPHHPSAGIALYFQDFSDDEEDDNGEDYGGVDDEEYCCSEGDDESVNDEEEDDNNEDHVGIDDEEVDDNNEDYESVDDEEDYYNEITSNEDYEGVDNEDYSNEEDAEYQVNGSQTSAQAQANTRQVELIEARKDSGRKSINPKVLPFPSQLALWPSSLNLTLLPCSSPERAEHVDNFAADINNDLFVQQGNNSMLASAMGQYLDISQAPTGGLVDLNLASNQINNEEELHDLGEDVEATSVTCSSYIHAAANLCFVLILRIQATCKSCLWS